MECLKTESIKLIKRAYDLKWKMKSFPRVTNLTFQTLAGEPTETGYTCGSISARIEDTVINLGLAKLSSITCRKRRCLLSKTWYSKTTRATPKLRDSTRVHPWRQQPCTRVSRTLLDLVQFYNQNHQNIRALVQNVLTLQIAFSHTNSEFYIIRICKS